MFPYSRRVMIVLIRSLYGVVSDGRVLGFSFHCRQQFERISRGSKHFVGSGFRPNCFSQCCVCRVSLTVSKPLDSCSPFHEAVVTSSAFPSHFLSLVLRAGISTGPYTQCGIRGPSEKAVVRWRCFPGRSVLLQMRRVLNPRKS